MNGVTGGVVDALPSGTTTFSHTSTTVRRRSAGDSASSWHRVLAVGSLEGGSSAELEDTDEEISTVAVSDVLRIGQGE